MPAGVELDTSELERGARQLAAGLDRAGPRIGMEQASATASRIRSRVPVRSGQLAATVTATAVDDGGAVTYGNGLPYAGYIEGRAHAVRDGLTGAETDFASKMRSAAETEVGKL